MAFRRPPENPELVVLVTGDRDWSSPKAIGAVLRSLGEPFILMHGDARGADRLAGAIASRMMMRVDPFPALWDQHDRSGASGYRCRCSPDATTCRVAGPRRNGKMLLHLMAYRALGHECRVIGFHNDLRRSKGTKHMIEIAKAENFRVTLVKQKPR